MGDRFLPDGGPARAFDTLWWQAGRFVEVTVPHPKGEIRVDVRAAAGQLTGSLTVPPGDEFTCAGWNARIERCS